MNRKYLTTVAILLTVILNAIINPQNKAQAQEPTNNWETTDLTSPYITHIINTPYGLFAGEYNPYTWQISFNGVYHSKDNGNTWKEIGLSGRGVLGLTYNKDTIYAVVLNATEEKPAGIYYKRLNHEDTWKNMGPNLPGASIGILENSIFFGTYNDGLWVSKDNGATWKNPLPRRDKPVRVEDIFIDNSIIIIETRHPETRFYSSLDLGNSWERQTWLEILQASDFLVRDNILYIASRYLGIVLSKDHRTIWSLLEGTLEKKILSMQVMGKNLYLSVKTEDSVEVIKSNNWGKTWLSTGLQNLISHNSQNQLIVSHALPETLLNHIYRRGIVKKEIQYEPSLEEGFLGNLWKNQKPNEILAKITSFFDHQYPLLGYEPFSEPKDAVTTTLNFLGQTGKAPDVYYSGHNGYDFGLPYGTEILAPAAGLVTGYYCPPCGNTIFVDHPNGYRTVYMHLQKERLFALPGQAKLPIMKGEVLGLVGMTGNTTGPHLHFEVRYPEFSQWYWSEMHPKGLIDPFGWQTNNLPDPWETFSWKDFLGEHGGRESKYLWKEKINLEGIKTAFHGNEILMSLENIKIDIPEDVHTLPLTFNVKYAIPNPAPTGKYYIPGTGLTINATNNTGNKISQLYNHIKLNFQITEDLLDKVIWETLNVYHWRKEGFWEKLSTVRSKESHTITALTNEISEFAVFAELLNNTYPTTTVTANGASAEHWFTEYPTITIEISQPGKILYSLQGEYWEEYDQPFTVEEEGFVPLRYRSVGTNGQVEPLRVLWLRIDTKGKTRKTLFIHNTQMTIL